MITMMEAERATGGRWLSRPLPLDRALRGGSVDTRALGGAEIFVALKGENFDGHDFLGKLAGSKVGLAVVETEAAAPGFSGNILKVENSLAALGSLGAFLVEKYSPKVIAITGSYGKTTAKELIAHVIGAERNVLKTPGSHNNEIGLPMALLNLNGDHDTAVLEFSARKTGDVAYLARLAPPDIAVLLAVGRAHIGVFGSQEAIYQAKAEIFRNMRPGGLAVVNAEDPRLRELAGDHRVVTFGNRIGDYRAEDIKTDEIGCQSFTGVNGDTSLPFRSKIPGAHGIYPILAAWAIARELGLADNVVQERSSFHPSQKGRSVKLKAPGGAVILDDTYNASPETVCNLITTLGSMAGDERILVLGHLSELEDGLEDSSALIARCLKPPLDRCIVHAPSQPEFSSQLKKLAEGFDLIEIKSLQELISTLRNLDMPGKVIGIKAGRSAHLERAVQGMLGKTIACELPTCGKITHCTDCKEIW